MPIISVCMPVYNGARYLSESITSVLQQTFTDFELIVVDDGSTDQSASIIQSFNDARLTYIKNDEQLGLVGNWNKCIEVASGEYLCIFHQDDVMLPQNLKKKINQLTNNPAVGFVYSDVLLINEKGRVTANRWYVKTEPETDFVHSGPDFFGQLMAGYNLVCCPSVVARRACYETVGGFDERLPYAADWEMWLRLALFYDVAYLVEPLLKYRWHPSNETHRFKGLAGLKQSYQCKMMVLDKFPQKVSDYQAQKNQVTRDYEQQTLDHIWYHYRRQEFVEAKEYLHYALELRTSSDRSYTDEEVNAWLLNLVDNVWLREQDASLAKELTAQAATQKFLRDLSSLDIAQTIPIRTLLRAIWQKILLHPKGGWLSRLRGSSQRPDPWDPQKK